MYLVCFLPELYWDYLHFVRGFSLGRGHSLILLISHHFSQSQAKNLQATLAVSCKWFPHYSGGQQLMGQKNATDFASLWAPQCTWVSSEDEQNPFAV